MQFIDFAKLTGGPTLIRSCNPPKKGPCSNLPSGPCSDFDPYCWALPPIWTGGGGGVNNGSGGSTSSAPLSPESFPNGGGTWGSPAGPLDTCNNLHLCSESTLIGGFVNPATVGTGAGGGMILIDIGVGTLCIGTGVCEVIAAGAAVAAVGAGAYIIYNHSKDARPSTEQKHQDGEARNKRDRGGEKGDARRTPPRKRPDGWRGPWPPPPNVRWW